MSSKKRLIFCTYSSFYSSIVLEQLLKSPDIEVVAIINSTRVLKPSYGHLRGAISQIQTTGWRYATYLFLVTDGFSWLQPLFKITPKPLKTIHAIANQQDIPVHDTRDINLPDSMAFITKQSSDVMLAAHFNQLIKPELLSLPMDCLNIHPSLLPDYKGVDPVFYAMLNNEMETGVTLHKMTESFDSGEILLQKKSLINPEDNLFSKNCQLFREGANLAINFLVAQNGKKEGRCALNENNSPKAYDSWPTPEKVSSFKSSGKTLIKLITFWRRGTHHSG